MLSSGEKQIVKKIKVDGKVYKVNSDDLRHYDGYIYKGELLKHAPVDTVVVGYITEGNENIGVCKKSLVKLVPVLYGGIALSAVSVIAFGVFVFNQEYHVTPWIRTTADGGNGTGELDDGTEKVNKKFSYTRYLTYDGSNVSLSYATDYRDAEIALSVDGKVTEYKSAKDAYSFPMDLELLNEDVKEGVLLLRRGESVEEYPIIVENLRQAEQIQLAMGSDSDREAAFNQVTQDIIEAGRYEEPEKATGQDGNLNLSAYTDDGVNIDFANFSVITVKKDYNQEDENVNP